MPSTIAALLIFAAGIAPGFLLLRGYQRARTYTDPPLTLYAIAQAIVLSACILLVAFPLVGWIVLGWAEHGTLLEGFHPWVLWGCLILLLVLPYLMGLFAGRLVDVLIAREEPDLPPRVAGRRFERLMSWGRKRLRQAQWDETLDWLGLSGPGTVWDRVWTQTVGTGEPVIVEIDLDADETVTGVFGEQSFVTTSPEPRQIFLEREYEEADVEEGRVLQERERSKGVFIDATAVRSIRFLKHVPVHDAHIE
jgi:hypothetical protein